MKLASFTVGGVATWGVIEATEAIDVGLTMKPQFADLRAFIAGGAWDSLGPSIRTAKRYTFDRIQWLPVIPNPDKIFCIGLNYETHRRETGREVAGYPTVFTRFADTQIGHNADLVRPTVSHEFDYEGEIAVVIGKPGRHISRDDAMTHIVGLSLYNDASVRDWQRHTTQFTPGKNFPRTGAFGPWMVTPDELGDLSRVRLTTKVDGLTVQDAEVGQMIFPIPHLVEYCSGFTSLNPGDVIVTGTPGGVGFRREPPLFLKPGSTVEVEATGIGRLVNGIADEVAS